MQNEQFENDSHIFESAQEEWDAVKTVIPAVGNGIAKRISSVHCELIAFNEALQFFQTADMHEYMINIRPTLERSGFWSLVHLLCGPPKIARDLVNERNLVFAIAACPMNNSESVHMRVLQTIYRQLTGDLFDCPRYGRHWELIGFQGSDPATDLRGAGFWGLMNLLHLVMCPATLLLACSIYKLSLHETQNFPFVVMSINITAIVLQVLREGQLNKICNRRKQVVAVVNDFYVAVFLHLYQRWKIEHKTISHSGFILKDVEDFARTNPKALFKLLESYLKESCSKIQANAQTSLPSQYDPTLASEAPPTFSILPRPNFHPKGSSAEFNCPHSALDNVNQDSLQHFDDLQNGKAADKYVTPTLVPTKTCERRDDEVFI